MEESLGDDGGRRDRKWSRSIAGSEEFVEMTKVELGIRAKGRKVIDSGEGYQLKEPQAYYSDIFDTKNADIGPENSYFWKIKPAISI